MAPENDRLTVDGIDEEGTIAFTAFGIQNLKELIMVHSGSAGALTFIERTDNSVTIER
jgi:hypothetical protein